MAGLSAAKVCKRPLFTRCEYHHQDMIRFAHSLSAQTDPSLLRSVWPTVYDQLPAPRSFPDVLRAYAEAEGRGLVRNQCEFLMLLENTGTA